MAFVIYFNRKVLIPIKKQREKKPKMSKIVVMHYVKLVFRTCLFLSATLVYIFNRIHATGESFGGFENNNVLLGVIWLIFIVEMFLRFFPSSLESMGCRKQFASQFLPVETATEKFKLKTGKTTFMVLVSWVILNGTIGALYLVGVLDRGIMLLIALFYSVCDVVCILFFCPFQTLIMKNKCCGTCRIYNWDYAMMFTPFLFVKNGYAWSLLGVALLLLLCWEIAVLRHPERFCESQNDSLSCGKCQEKLCHHKKQLRYFLKQEKLRERFNLKGNILFKKEKR